MESLHTLGLQQKVLELGATPRERIMRYQVMIRVSLFAGLVALGSTLFGQVGDRADVLGFNAVELAGLPAKDGQRLFGSDGSDSFLLIAGREPLLDIGHGLRW